MTSENITFLTYWYSSIVPLWFMDELRHVGGQSEAFGALQRWLGEPLSHDGDAMLPAMVHETLIPGTRYLVFQNRAPASLTVSRFAGQTVRTSGGTLALEARLLQRYLEDIKSKQALFALFKPFSAHANRVALVTIGSPYLISTLIAALSEKDVADPGEFETLQAVIQALKNGQILRVEPLQKHETEVEAFNRLAAIRQGGTLSLHLDSSMLAGLRGDSHFAFGQAIASEDLIVASVLAVTLKILSAIVSNIPDKQLCREFLKKFVAENLPGVQGGGYEFTISHLSLLAEAFNNQALIASQSYKLKVGG